MSDLITKESIFQEFCISKNNLANEFVIDNILFNLGLSVPFYSKYYKIKQFILDFIIIADRIIKFYIRYSNKEDYNLENVIFILIYRIIFSFRKCFLRIWNLLKMKILLNFCFIILLRMLIRS